jgi:hypothetical protein
MRAVTPIREAISSSHPPFEKRKERLTTMSEVIQSPRSKAVRSLKKL